MRRQVVNYLVKKYSGPNFRGYLIVGKKHPWFKSPMWYDLNKLRTEDASIDNTWQGNLSCGCPVKTKFKNMNFRIFRISSTWNSKLDMNGFRAEVLKMRWAFMQEYIKSKRTSEN